MALNIVNKNFCKACVKFKDIPPINFLVIVK